MWVEHVDKSFHRYRPYAPLTLKTALVDWARRTRRPRGADRLQVLHDVSFELAPGETLGLIGRNGSGKSTLLKTMAGIYRPNAGRVRVRGSIAALIELGAGFHPEFTGRENVLINGIVLGLSRREVAERYDSIVGFAQLAEFMDAPVRTYSSGMYLRLAFSIAIHVDPDLLLVDELLAVGDEAFQRKCRAVFDQRVHSRRQITVLVSHDMDAIEGLCGRVALIDPPHVRLYDDPRSAISDYRRLLSGVPHA